MLIGKGPMPRAFVKNNQRQLFNIQVADWGGDTSWDKQEAGAETQKENLENKMFIWGFKKLWHSPGDVEGQALWQDYGVSRPGKM